MRAILHTIADMLRDALASLRPSSEGVAVIIPVYNVTTFLEEAIRSAATQRYRHKEIIVVDDGSREESAEEIQRVCALFPDVMLLRRPHAGAAAARDAGVSHASSSMIMFLDADDVLLPGTIRYLTDALKRNPDAIAAYGNITYIDGQGNRTGRRNTPTPSGKGVLLGILDRQLCICNGSICMRKAALQALAPQNHTIPCGEDWVLWCHLALSGEIVFAGDRDVLQYRQHGGNVSYAFANNEHTAIIAAYDTVFTHPAFIAAIGEDEIRLLREKCVSRLHIALADDFARNAMPDRAAYHWAQVSVPLSRLGEAAGGSKGTE